MLTTVEKFFILIHCQSITKNTASMPSKHYIERIFGCVYRYKIIIIITKGKQTKFKADQIHVVGTKQQNSDIDVRDTHEGIVDLSHICLCYCLPFFGLCVCTSSLSSMFNTIIEVELKLKSRTEIKLFKFSGILQKVGEVIVVRSQIVFYCEDTLQSHPMMIPI